MYRSRVYANNCVFETVHEESVKAIIYTCTTGGVYTNNIENIQQ